MGKNYLAGTGNIHTEIKMRINVNYIRTEREDAIGKVSDHLLTGLDKKVSFNIILFKTKVKNRLLRYLGHFDNIINLSKYFFKS